MDKIPYKILLVDDDPFVLVGIGKELESEGYCVCSAPSGESALEMLEEKKNAFDIVITDLIMGGIGGIQVLEKSKQVNFETMVMILTGYGELESAIQAIRIGADDYMLKPGTPEERSFRIKELINKYELKRKIKLYEKILPICCVCKRIRDDAGKNPGEGDWMPVDEFLYKKGKIQVSHGYCPTCYKKLMDEIR
jgi:DNA-binding response OmpR family regulator